jgi:ankyrin repeat protein
MDNWDEITSLIKLNDHKQLGEHIKRNPDLTHITNFNSYTLLMIAVTYHANECAELLIQSRADLNLQDNFGDTALMDAANRNNFIAAQNLLKHGAKISLRNLHGESALGLIMLHDPDRLEWIELFGLYKDQLDEIDLQLYLEHRLSALLAKTTF